MRYKENQFTDKEKESIFSVAEKVCYFFGITMDDLLSLSRKREIVEARMIVCYYQFHNIQVESMNVKKSYSLSCWFFDKDHTTGHHYVNTCNDILNYNAEFKYNYYVIANLIDKHNEAPQQPLSKESTWNDVKNNLAVSNKDKYALMPLDVKESIDTYIKKRYSYGFIADVLNTNYEFINYYISVNGVNKNKVRAVSETRRANVPTVYGLINGR